MTEFMEMSSRLMLARKKVDYNYQILKGAKMIGLLNKGI